MEWEEVGVDQAVEASSRVRELLKEELLKRELLKEEVMEGVEEEGEGDMVPAAEGQHGKLVMVVDTNVLLSNGFPLVQELIQRGVCTVFLPWQVPSEYELKIFWASGCEAPIENDFESRSCKSLTDINLALRQQFRLDSSIICNLAFKEKNSFLKVLTPIIGKICSALDIKALGSKPGN